MFHRRYICPGVKPFEQKTFLFFSSFLEKCVYLVDQKKFKKIKNLRCPLIKPPPQHTFTLELPLLDELVELPLLLLHAQGIRVGLLNIHHQILHVHLQAVLALLQAAALDHRLLDLLLGLAQLGRQLSLRLLQLFGAQQRVRFVLALPQQRITARLRQTRLQLILVGHLLAIT